MTRIGLVLGAGGFVGHAFHCGVLSALEDATGWDARNADIVIGTSAGSIVAATLRGGMSAKDMTARTLGEPLSVEGARIAAIVGPPVVGPSLDDLPARRWRAASRARLSRAWRKPFDARFSTALAALAPEGRLPTEHISEPFHRLHGDTWPREATWLCAVELHTGRRVAFGRDRFTDVGSAVAASCAIPGYFRPVVIDGEPFVDGGAHSPSNVDLLMDAGVELAIVLSPMSFARGSSPGALDVTMRAWARSLLAVEITRLRAHGVTVVTFQPDAGDIRVMGLNAMDPARRAAVVRRARATTFRRLEKPTLRAGLEALTRS